MKEHSQSNTDSKPDRGSGSVESDEQLTEAFEESFYGDYEETYRLRDRVRHRIGVSERQWIHLVSLIIVLPYPIAIFLYLSFPIQESVFLLVTGLYSIFAMYLSYIS